MGLLSEARDLHHYFTRKLGNTRDIEIRDDYSFTIYNPDGSVQKEYKPSTTGLTFHQDQSFVRFIMGPYGGGKSTTCNADIIIKACNMPRCTDGVRRMRCVVVRNTMPDLKMSTILTWDYWFGELGAVKIYKDSPYYYFHTFSDGEGVIELQVFFLSGDESPKKLDKFLSTEFTIAYLNEGSALPEILLERLKGRVGRWPPQGLCPEEYWRGVIMDSNPPKERSWVYELFEKKMPEGFKQFKQPPGLLQAPESPNGWITNPEADNIDNLSINYYINMAKGASLEFIKVACLGQYGLMQDGEPVYGKSYNDDIHALEDIEFDRDEPLYLGWDYGLTPACMIAQFVNGQLRLIKEFVSGFNTSVEELAENSVLPFLTKVCENMTIAVSVGDKSNPKGSAVKISPTMILDSLGLETVGAPTNDIIPRIDSVKFFLGKLVGGKPALLISKKGCPVSREGFITDYKYQQVKMLGTEQMKETPEKSHPHSDIQDAIQYIALVCHGGYMPSQPIDQGEFMRHSTSGWANARRV